MNRLFVALDLPGEVRAALPSPGEGWRAVPRDSLHVTLAFLGHREDAGAVVAAVRSAMRPISALALDEVVLLPPRRPRVMAVRLAGDVSALQSAVTTSLDAVERRAYLPHVTIGRARAGRPPRSLPDSPPLSFTAPSVTVYESHLSREGARYEALATFPVLTIGSDAAAIRAVRLAALADAPASFAKTLAEESALPSTWWESMAARSAAGERDRVFLAPGAGGMAGGHRDGEDVELWGMWVAPAARGAGLGRMLLEAVTEWAGSIGAQRVVLLVRDGVPRAAQLYESAGFERSRRVGDEIRYVLRL